MCCNCDCCMAPMQTERQVFMQLLAEHGITQPELPELLSNAAASPSPSAAVPIESTARAESAAGQACSSSSLSNSSAALMAQLMLMRVHSAGAGSCHGSGILEYTANSPHVRVLSATVGWQQHQQCTTATCSHLVRQPR